MRASSVWLEGAARRRVKGGVVKGREVFVQRWEHSAEHSGSSLQLLQKSVLMFRDWFLCISNPRETPLAFCS